MECASERIEPIDIFRKVRPIGSCPGLICITVLLVWMKTVRPIFVTETIARPKKSGTIRLWSLVRLGASYVTRAAITRYKAGATVRISHSMFALLTILALSGNIGKGWDMRLD